MKNQPAFPSLKSLECDRRDYGVAGHYVAETVGGMTLRDYFAAAYAPVAMSVFSAKLGRGVMQDPKLTTDAEFKRQIEEFWNETASVAYAFADAMLAERSKP